MVEMHDINHQLLKAVLVYFHANHIKIPRRRIGTQDLSLISSTLLLGDPYGTLGPILYLGNEVMANIKRNHEKCFFQF